MKRFARFGIVSGLVLQSVQADCGVCSLGPRDFFLRTARAAASIVPGVVSVQTWTVLLNLLWLMSAVTVLSAILALF